MDIQPYDHTKELFEEAIGLTHNVIVHTITQLEDELARLLQSDEALEESNQEEKSE